MLKFLGVATFGYCTNFHGRTTFHDGYLLTGSPGSGAEFDASTPCRAEQIGFGRCPRPGPDRQYRQRIGRVGNTTDPRTPRPTRIPPAGSRGVSGPPAPGLRADRSTLSLCVGCSGHVTAEGDHRHCKVYRARSARRSTSSSLVPLKN